MALLLGVQFHAHGSALNHSSMQQKFTTHKNPFTVIELLLVVMLVLILFSLLQPAMKRMVSHAGNVNCRANLSLIAHAMTGYLDDHAENYLSEFWNYDGPTYMRQDKLVATKFGNYQVTFDREYLENKKAFQCPVSTKMSRGGWKYDESQVFSYDYAMNSWLYNKELSWVKKPSQLVFTTDSNYEWLHFAPRVDVRHDLELNVLWVDGHSSTVPYTDFYHNFQWMAQFKPVGSAWDGEFTIR